jgi:hypothetical protein
MAKKNRRRPDTAAPTSFDQARDELFQHIMRCQVIGAAEEHQVEWFNDTIAYLGEHYPDLSEAQLTELKTLGMRFVQPPKARVSA